MIAEQARSRVSNVFPCTNRKLSSVANWLNRQQKKENSNESTLLSPIDRPSSNVLSGVFPPPRFSTEIPWLEKRYIRHAVLLLAAQEVFFFFFYLFS